jgi:putative transcriptional regulator
MAEVKMTAAAIREHGGYVDRAKVDATTEEDIRRQMIEDGEDPDNPGEGWYPAPGSVRRLLGMTQTEIADLLRIPVATWRNWEQYRVRVEPAVQALLRILAREPDAAKRALDRAA